MTDADAVTPISNNRSYTLRSIHHPPNGHFFTELVCVFFWYTFLNCVHCSKILAPNSDEQLSPRHVPSPPPADTF